MSRKKEARETKKLGQLTISIYSYDKLDFDEEDDGMICMPRDLAEIQALIGQWIDAGYQTPGIDIEVHAIPRINY